MEILYCNIGEMQDYNGSDVERPVGGGKFNITEIGHEVNNFTKCGDKYYGFVQSSSGAIAVEKHFSHLSQDKTFAEHVLVVWVVDKKKIVGWYKDATVYRNWMHLDQDIASIRKYDDYNIMSKEGVLLPDQDRRIMDYGFGRSNIWYGSTEADDITKAFIGQYENTRNTEIQSINSPEITGAERETITKQRINQSKYRQGLLVKYGKACVLCRISLEPLLVASHIKPWSVSDPNEKVDLDNGLLLCPHHDKLFDTGYISFDDTGKIMISPSLDNKNQIMMNIAPDMRIRISGRMGEYLRYHRENKFKQNEE